MNKLINKIIDELYCFDDKIDIPKQYAFSVLLTIMIPLTNLAQIIVFERLYSTQFEALVSFSILIALYCIFVIVVWSKLRGFFSWNFLIIFIGVYMRQNFIIIFGLLFFISCLTISLFYQIKDIIKEPKRKKK